jgi:hypothetical protein
MGMSAVYDQVGAIEGGCEKSLVALEFQLVRHHSDQRSPACHPRIR